MPRCRNCWKWIESRENLGARCPSCRAALYEKPHKSLAARPGASLCAVHEGNLAVGTCQRCGSHEDVLIPYVPGDDLRDLLVTSCLLGRRGNLLQCLSKLFQCPPVVKPLNDVIKYLRQEDPEKRHAQHAAKDGRAKRSPHLS